MFWREGREEVVVLPHHIDANEERHPMTRRLLLEQQLVDAANFFAPQLQIREYLQERVIAQLVKPHEEATEEAEAMKCCPLKTSFLERVTSF